MATIYDIVVDSTVNAGVTDTSTFSAIVPSGAVVKVNKFGGYDMTSNGLIALQWGSGSTWFPVRAGGAGAFELIINREFIGDGVKRFRIVRQNNSGTNRAMPAWLEALVYGT